MGTIRREALLRTSPLGCFLLGTFLPSPASIDVQAALGDATVDPMALCARELKANRGCWGSCLSQNSRSALAWTLMAECAPSCTCYALPVS